MVLEMASSSDMDKALVKASSQNKLGYEFDSPSTSGYARRPRSAIRGRPQGER